MIVRSTFQVKIKPRRQRQRETAIDRDQAVREGIILHSWPLVNKLTIDSKKIAIAKN